jgi:hypothetical protein
MLPPSCASAHRAKKTVRFILEGLLLISLTAWFLENALLFSGHKTERQVVVYDRKVKISPTLDLPVLGKSEDDDGELYTKRIYQHYTKCDMSR